MRRKRKRRRSEERVRNEMALMERCTLLLRHRSSSPRRRGSSTPRPIDSITTVSGILDHPPARVRTVVGVSADTTSRSRGAFRPRLAINFLALRSEGAGNAGRPMRPIAARAMVVGRTHTRCQVTPESPGTPRAVVYAYTCTPRRSAFLPPSPAGLTAGLTPAPRCQDNTISPSASGTLVRSALRVHRIPPRAGDVAQRPSGWDGMARI